jgi:hypothetical protein
MTKINLVQIAKNNLYAFFAVMVKKNGGSRSRHHQKPKPQGIKRQRPKKPL